jgi:lipopolysaccharide transport system permease protein
MPLSIVASNLIRFGVQVMLFIILLVFYNIKGGHLTLNLYALLFPVLIVLIAAQGLGLGMMVSAVTTKYRDIAFIVSFGVPLLMYATTVIYPLSVAEAKFHAYSWIVKYNPITAVIETFRYGFLGKGDFSWWLLGYCTAVTFVILLLGTIIFSKVEKNFIDTV